MYQQDDWQQQILFAVFVVMAEASADAEPC